MCDHCGCRNFAPIAELTAEHVEILELAWELSESAREGREVAPDVVPRLVALLEVHDAKEEAGLYPVLLALGGLATDTCETLEAEHRDMLELLDAGGFDRRAYFALAAHIELEELELFSAAMLRCDEEDWATMAEAHHAADHAFGRAHSHAGG